MSDFQSSSLVKVIYIELPVIILVTHCSSFSWIRDVVFQGIRWNITTERHSARGIGTMTNLLLGTVQKI